MLSKSLKLEEKMVTSRDEFTLRGSFTRFPLQTDAKTAGNRPCLHGLSDVNGTFNGAKGNKKTQLKNVG